MISLIELKWIIRRGGKNNKELRNKLEIAFSDALRFLDSKENFKSHPFNLDIINDISYELELYGHLDYFDNLILASSILSSDFLLTQDEAFTLLTNKQKNLQSPFYNENLRIINWKEFVKLTDL